MLKSIRWVDNICYSLVAMLLATMIVTLLRQSLPTVILAASTAFWIDFVACVLIDVRRAHKW